MIEVRSLTKKFGHFTAVDNISFKINKGEIFAFLGVNGAGKTTTIRMLVGILQPSSGIIQIGDYITDQDPERAKSIIGYIPDRPYIYSKLTGLEFLYFIADLYKVPEDKASENINSLIERFSLTRAMNDLVESYSHGMKQRLATCAALLHDPKVLIVDEPMVGLDPHGAKLLKATLREYADKGTTIFLSTHSLHVAEELADRMAIIQKGSIKAMGTLSEIKDIVGLKGGLESIFLQITVEGFE